MIISAVPETEYIHRVLGDLPFADAYTTYEELLEKQEPKLKKLLLDNIPDQETFRQSVYSLTGGRISLIKRYFTSVREKKAIPTGACLSAISHECIGTSLK